MHLHDFAARVELREGISETLGLHDEPVQDVGAGEVKVQRLTGLLRLETALRHNSSLL